MLHFSKAVCASRPHDDPSSNVSSPSPVLAIVLLILSLSPHPLAAGPPQILQEGSTRSTISGRVHDAAGAPLAGALVAVQAVNETFRERLVVTGRTGVFLIPGLVAGQYVVRVSKTSFLPAVAGSVEIQAGSSAVLQVNLQTALDIARQGFRRGSLEDMKWVLRSSPSARPVLHLVHASSPADLPGVPAEPDSPLASEGAEEGNAGYVQVYSTAMAIPIGAGESLGSEFAFNMPVMGGSQVTFSGQYIEARGGPRGFAATYGFAPGTGKRSSIALNIRQGAHLNAEYGQNAREVQLGYREDVQWSENIVVSYGAAVGRSDGPAESRNYFRPELSVAWIPRSATVLSAAYSRRAPSDAADPIRGREYFDRAVYIPAEMEHYSHVEIGASHRLSDSTEISVAAFRDALGGQAFLTGSGGGRREVVFLDAAESPTSGVRVALDRVFPGLEAGVVYTFANAPAFDPAIWADRRSADEVRGGVHMFTARVRTEIAFTQTAVTAVYRWASGFSLTPVDPYQRFSEYNDPTLSITVAQDLPGLKILPASLQAIVDARNLLEPAVGSGRAVSAAYPRVLKGGIHIRF